MSASAENYWRDIFLHRPSKQPKTSLEFSRPPVAQVTLASSEPLSSEGGVRIRTRRLKCEELALLCSGNPLPTRAKLDTTAYITIICCVTHGAIAEVGRTATQRELFYRVVSEGSGLFSSQQIMDRAMRDAVGALRIGRPHLGVLTTEKGLLAGEISFSHDNSLSVAAQGATGTCIGESMLDHRTRFHVGERAQIVLVVEKDTVFQHLLQSKLFTTLPLILVTGRGYPDVLTRRFLQKLHRVAPRLMQVYLGDFDPDGVAIYLVYHRSCSHLRWLGMHEPDVSKLPSGACLPLSKRDKALQQSLLRKADVQHVRGLAEQVQSMTCKAGCFCRVYLAFKREFFFFSGALTRQNWKPCMLRMQTTGWLWTTLQ